MSDVSFSPSYAITMLFNVLRDLGPLILAEFEDGQHFIASVAKEMVRQWELLHSLQLCLQCAEV